MTLGPEKPRASIALGFFFVSDMWSRNPKSSLFTLIASFQKLFNIRNNRLIIVKYRQLDGLCSIFLAYSRSQSSCSQLGVKPAAPVNEHQSPHLVVAQVDHIAVASGVAAVSLNDAGVHQLLDGGVDEYSICHFIQCLYGRSDCACIFYRKIDACQ